MAVQLLHGPKCSCTPDPQAECPGCEKMENTEKMKKCPRCFTLYCTSDCMKKHHKKHLQICAKLAHGTRAPKRCDARPFHAICFQNFLWDRSEKETFDILRDVRRMTMEDGKNVWIWDYSPDRVNGVPPPGFPDIRRYLELLKRIKGFLPPWWTDEKAEECALYCEQTDDQFQWTGAWERDHLQQWNTAEEMPCKLRLLSQAVVYICTNPAELENEELRMALGATMRSFTKSITELMAQEGSSPDEMMRALAVYEESLRM